jgi:large subunit ribosomal protein L35
LGGGARFGYHQTGRENADAGQEERRLSRRVSAVNLTSPVAIAAATCFPEAASLYSAARIGGERRANVRLGAAVPDTDIGMPKLKTKSGAKKRFGRTGTGKIVRNWGHKRHRLISKSKQGKRLRRGTTTMEPGDAKLVMTYMPYLRS